MTITVDPSGNGNFSTIQSAIDSVPSNNAYWITIYVKAGRYREKVTIPNDKPYITLQGEGQDNTFVEWNDHDSIARSATFSTMANNVVVKHISFRNSYNNPKNGNPIVAAVAAMVSGDKSYFLNVGFYGLQDTLWDDQGRHYYNICTIEGAVDFIFGTGQSLYEECTISVIGAALAPGVPGYITAQGRTNPNDGNGFVFKNCQVSGNGTTYLGRPWRSYARVLFYKTSMSQIVQPSGWEPWNFAGHEDQLTFAEYENSGPGSDTSKRVKWTKKLSLETVNAMASLSFVDNDGWLKDLALFFYENVEPFVERVITDFDLVSIRTSPISNSSVKFKCEECLKSIREWCSQRGAWCRHLQTHTPLLEVHAPPLVPHASICLLKVEEVDVTVMYTPPTSDREN
ncbi:probable pectinesterase 55 [Abrus precatorius]|uniref:Pectinesterase n=1 Tax=Abrus precatorius TaxID=3816 RepID=A0A8B8M6G9_ABRPR|nr:probable pectinesterase 55 [Abrus precatorius]